MKKLLLNLKTILKSNYLFIIITFISITYISYNLFIREYKSIYNINDKIFYLRVENIKKTNNGYTITLNNKEKIIGFIKGEFDYNLGDYLKINGELEVPENNRIPNNFNYKKYLYNEKIYYTLNIKNVTLIKENNNIIYKIKDYISKYLNRFKSNKYMNAFIMGDTSYIDNDKKKAYQNIGVSHLLAIGGMQLNIIISILSILLKKLKEKYSFTIITIFLIFYLFLVNFQISIVRSTITYLLLKINKYLNINLNTTKISIIGLLIVLTSNPFIIYNLGFQYSYLISFILLKYSNLIKGKYIKQLIIISTISLIVSLPITIYNNYQINYLSIIYNLFYVPFINIIIFPLSLLTLLFPILDNTYYIITNFLEIITIFLNNINTNLIFQKPSLFLIIIYYFSIFILLSKVNRNKLYIIPFILLLLFNYFYKSQFVTFIDVDQGDSILISNNYNILIDTGGTFKKDYSDNLITYFKSMGMRKLNYLIITHGDFDHIGSAINLVNNFKVENVIFNCGEFNNLEKELIYVLDNKKIKNYSCIKELNIDDNKLYFLNNKYYDNENDNSIVLYIKINNYKFLFMGDASLETEKDILNNYNLKDIDILKVGHHGSKTSSSKDFINIINPKYSVISVGKNNRYGHPNSEVLDILEASNIYRTDLYGSVMFKFNKDKLNISTCPP